MFLGSTEHSYEYYQVGRIDFRWVTFAEDVCTRFEDVNHEDIVAKFNTLQQEGKVSDY